MKKTLVFLTVLVFALCSSTVATADDYSPSFESMAGQVQRGQLVLNYEMSSKSWKRLKALDVKPKLNLYKVRRGKDTFVATQTLVSRKGSFTFSKRKATLQNGDTIKIRIHGTGGEHRITAWHLGSRSGKELSFTIRGGQLASNVPTEPQIEPTSAPASQPTQPSAPAGWRAAVVKACDEHAYLSRQKGECVELAMKIDPRWAADTVEACREFGYLHRQLHDCLKIAADHKTYNPSETAEACKENAYLSRQFLDCMKTTADYKAPPAKLLPACADTVYLDRQRAECFEMAADLQSSDIELLSACEGRDWKKCVEAATATQR